MDHPLESDLRTERFPLGATVTVDALDRDPHPILLRLRAAEPVSWLPALDGWLITGHELATIAMRDAATFTVDDPRFSTAQVIGPSMLSLDGDAHARHRAPFTEPFRAVAVNDRFAGPAAERAAALIADMRPAGRGELRRGFAGPMAAAIVTRALGIDEREVQDVLAAYDAIVASVTEISAGHPPTPAGTEAFAELRRRLQPMIDGTHGDSLLAEAAGAGDASLSDDQIASDAAVLLFGGIETTEGMIANAALELLHRPDELRRVAGDAETLSAVLDESLRLEPAAAVIDRYATRDTELGGAHITRGELVRISLTGANRDPKVFPEPDRWDPSRANARRHLAFAQGPHVCVGVHLARLEARAALQALLTLPALRLDPAAPAPAVRGLVFRKPLRLDAVWDTA